MTINIYSRFSSAVGALLMIYGLIEVLSYGFSWPPLSEIYQALVILGLGVALWGICAILTLLIAIDERLHKTPVGKIDDDY